MSGIPSDRGARPGETSWQRRRSADSAHPSLHPRRAVLQRAAGAVGLSALGGSAGLLACLPPAGCRSPGAQPAPALGTQLDHWIASLPEQPACWFLGELDHFIAGKHAVTLVVLERLLAGGVDLLAVEHGPADARWLQRYLDTGDPGHLEQLELWRLAGDSHAAGSGAGFVARERRFWRGVRELAQRHLPGGRLRVRGFDLEQAPSAAWRHARELLAGRERGMLTAEIETALRGAAQPLAERAATATALARRAADRLGPSDPASAVLADAERAFRHHAELERAGTNTRVRAAVQQRRELDLAERLEAALLPALLAPAPRPAGAVPARAVSPGRAVVLGHAFHLTLRNAPLFWGPPGRDLPHWPSAGARLAARLAAAGLGTRALWMLFGSGTREAPGERPTPFAPLPGSLEAALVARAVDGLEPLSAHPGDHLLRVNGRAAHGELERLADALLFVPG